MYRIMLLDDERAIINSLARFLKCKRDWELETFLDANEALRSAQMKQFDLVLSDYRMPQMDGVQFLIEMKKIQPEAMRIILSGFTDIKALLGAINKAEIFRFICKPWEDDVLISSMELALAHREILLENRRLADMVRDQKLELGKRKTALDSIRNKHPELNEVSWSDDGSIILDEPQSL